MALCIAVGTGVRGAEGMSELERVELRFQKLRLEWRQVGASTETGWKLAQACFERAEFATNKLERSSLAEIGMAAAQEVLRRESNSAPGHFYYAMNLGQMARTRHLSALGMVSDMEEHFLTAIALDPQFRQAAPHRSLGMLYRDAPGWPASVGSRSKARRHLEKAVELCPGYPENLLTLLESELEWGERKKVAARLAEMDRRLADAESQWSGEEWTASWKGWRARAEILRQSLSQPPRPEPGLGPKSR